MEFKPTHICIKFGWNFFKEGDLTMLKKCTQYPDKVIDALSPMNVYYMNKHFDPVLYTTVHGGGKIREHFRRLTDEEVTFFTNKLTNDKLGSKFGI